MSLKCGNLTLIASNGDEKLLKTNGKVFRIGSYMSCDLVLENDDAKRIHCEIQCDAFGRISITNHSKRNPVQINGVPVKGTRPLYTGSLVTVFDKKLRWINNQRVTRKGNTSTSDATVEIKTPKGATKAEHVPNSAPSLLTRKKQKSQRLTMHTLLRNTDMESDDDFQAVNDENDDEFQTSLTRESMRCATKNVGATPPRTNKRMSIALNRRTIKNTNKTNSIKTEVNSNNMMLLKCQSSGMVVTSYSPSATPNKTPKSFARVMSNANTPVSAYGTPRSVLSELNEDLISVNNDVSPKTPLTSMYLIDFTTPDIYKTPIQKRKTPLFKSALKNSAAKSALKSAVKPKHTISTVSEGSQGNRNTTPLKSNKIRWESPNSLKKIESPTPKKIVNNLTYSAGLLKKQIPNTTEKTLARKSISRLSFAATETPPALLTRRDRIISNSNTPVLSTDRMSIAARKSMNRSVSTPLKTPKAIFAANSSTKKSSRLSLLNRPTPKQHSTYTPESNTTSPKNITEKSENNTTESMNVGLLRSTTFILDGPTVSKTVENEPKSTDDTFNCKDDTGLGEAEIKSPRSLATPIIEETNELNDEDIIKSAESNTAEMCSKLQNKRSPISSENKDLSDPPVGKKINKLEILNDLTDVEGVKHLYSTRSMVKTPIFKGIKELVKTPKAQPETNLVGIKELVNTPKTSSSLDNVKGMKELFNTPTRNDLTDLLGVKELINTPKTSVGLDDPKGVKELFNTPMRDDLTDVFGVKELVNTPKTINGLENPKGLKELFNTPMRDDLTDVNGVRELLKTPVFRTPKLIGVQKILKTANKDDGEYKDIFKTPASQSVMVLGTPMSIEVKKNLNSTDDLLKTPVELSLQEDMEDVGKIFNTPVSKFVDFPEEEETENKPNDENNMSPEESFDKLIGKPMIKRTYGRASMTPKVMPIPTTHESPEDCVKTDIQDWVDNVDNINQSDEELFESITQTNNKSNILNSNSPTLDRVPLAASSSIKPKLRRSLRKSDHVVEITEMSGIEQLDETINSGSEFSGVLLYSEESDNDNESAVNVEVDESKTRKLMASRLLTTNSSTPRKSVQFADKIATGPLKMTPQIRRIRGRIATPRAKKNPISEESSRNGPFNDLSIQFIDESTVIDPETAANTSRYKINQSKNGTDISIEPVNDTYNSDSMQTVDEEDFEQISVTDSVDESRRKSKRKSRKTINEKGLIIFISDDETESSDDNENDPICVVDSPTVNLTANKEMIENVACGSERETMDISSKSNKLSETLNSKVQRLTRSRENIAEEENNLSLNVTTKSLSLADSKSYAAEESKLLNLYDLEVTNEKYVTNPVEVVYVTSEEQLEATLDEKTLDETFGNFKEKPLLRETRAYSQSAEKSIKISKPSRKTLGENSKNDSFALEKLRKFKTQSLLVNSTPTKTDLSGGAKQVDQLNGSSKTLWKSVILDSTINTDEQADEGDLPTTEEEFDLSFESCSEAENIENEFENFAENPSKISQGKSQTPNLKNKQKQRKSMRKTLGSVSAANNSFDYKKELERRNMSIEFKNFATETQTIARRGRSQSARKIPRSVQNNRRTMGTPALSESFDYEVELNRRNLSMEFKNFDADEINIKTTRGRSESPEKKEKSAVNKRYTVGQNSANKSFDYDAELERRNMSVEFQNFESDGPSAKPLRGCSASPQKKPNVVQNVRRTLGANASNQSFDYEGEWERRNRSLEFQNFKSEGQVATARRGRSMSPQKKMKLAGVNNRRTVGQATLDQSFDYEGELERRNMSLEFQNFELKDPKPRAFRARSQSPQKKSKTITNSRRTLGQKPLNESFDYEGELERRNMSLEFQNFASVETKSKLRRAQSMSIEKVTKRSCVSHRRTVGQKPSNDSFDYQAELDRRNLSLEFKNFDENQFQVKNVRSRSQSPGKKSKRDASTRKTVGQAPLNEEFDYEAELERRNMSIEFANFDENGKNLKAAGARSVSPVKKVRNILNKRRTVGQEPLNDSFDYDKEIERRKMSLDFENFDTNKPEIKTTRGYSTSPLKKIEKSTNIRKTLGQKPSTSSFDLQAEKERLEFANFEERPKLKLPRSGSTSPPAKSIVIKTNRRTMGNETDVNLDFEMEKMKYLQMKNSSSEVEKGLEQQSSLNATNNANGNEQKRTADQKRKLFSHQLVQIDEEIDNVTEARHYEVSKDDEAEIVFKPLTNKIIEQKRTRNRNKSSQDSETVDDEVHEMKVTRTKRRLPAETKLNPENESSDAMLDASRHVHFGDIVYYEVAAEKADEKIGVDSGKPLQNKRAKRVGRKAKVVKENPIENEERKAVDQLDNETENSENLLQDHAMKESKEDTHDLDSKRSKVDDIVKNSDASEPVVSLEEKSIAKPRGRRAKKTAGDVISTEHQENNLNKAEPIPKTRRRGKKDTDQDDVIEICDVTAESIDADQKIVLIDQVAEVAEVPQPSSKTRGRRGKKTVDQVEKTKVSETSNSDVNVAEDRKLEDNQTEAAETVQSISKVRGRRGKTADLPVAAATVQIPEETKNHTEQIEDLKLSEEILTDQVVETAEIVKPISKTTRSRRVQKAEKENDITENNAPVQLIKTEIENEPVVRSRTRQPRKVQPPPSDKDLAAKCNESQVAADNPEEFSEADKSNDMQKNAEEGSIINKPQLPEEKPAPKRGRRAKKIEEIIEIEKEDSEAIIKKEKNPQIQIEEIIEVVPKTRGRRKVVAQPNTTPQHLDVNVQPIMRVTRARSVSIDTPIINNDSVHQNLLNSDHKGRLGLPTKETGTPITPIAGNNLKIEFKTPTSVAPRGRKRLASATLDAASITPIDEIPEKKTTRPRGRRVALLQSTESDAAVESKTEVKPKSRTTRLRSITADEQTTPSSNETETDNVVIEPNSDEQLSEKKITRTRGRRAALEPNTSNAEVESKPVVKSRSRATKLRATTATDDQTTPVADVAETENVISTPKARKGGRRPAGAVVEAEPTVIPETENKNDIEKEDTTAKTKRTGKVKETVTSAPEVPEAEANEEDENTSSKSRGRAKRKITEVENIDEAPKRTTRARRK